MNYEYKLYKMLFPKVKRKTSPMSDFRSWFAHKENLRADFTD